eukprot:TRINITY_DN5855_c0_g1_i2.p1 TRINITY_DN5855_c0_g1~~TRINITY_DN5855_c0_g1_i2.p1  ORF type:complete len:335 (+),score=66.20 TRINITY_DN5855_c0_g1_i2:71-1006(+)
MTVSGSDRSSGSKGDRAIFGLPRWLVQLFAGGISGTFAKSSIAPLERVKILFQIRSKHYPYSGVFSTLKSVSNREGFVGLWKGNSATVVRIFPYAAIQFFSYEKSKELLLGRSIARGSAQSEMHVIANLTAGAMAGFTSVIFTYPLDLIRVHMAVAVERRQYTGIGDAFRKIHAADGVRGLYRGLWPTLLGIVPYAVVNFGTFETLKTLAPKNDKGQPSLTFKLFAGGLAGALGQTVAYPLDVVRRLMQTSGLADAHGINHRGIWAAITHIVRTEGIHGLFKGLSINYIRVAPMVAISFTTYEFLKVRLQL